MKPARFALGLVGALLTMALAWTAPAFAADAPACQLMIDASGSMDGYRAAEGAPLLALISSLRQLCPTASLFGDRLRALGPSEPIVFKDGTTNIGPELLEWSASAPDHSFLIVITDNVADAGDTPGDATAQFYDLLRRPDSPFSQIVVIALRAPFDGQLYYPLGVHKPPVPYKGPRALTLYVLGKGAAGDTAAFAQLRQAVGGALQASGRRPADAGAVGDYDSYALFDVKPFAAEAFHVVSKAASIDTVAERGRAGCNANARFDEATRTFLLVGQPMDRNCDLGAKLIVSFPDRWCLVDSGLSATVQMNASDPDVIKQSVKALPVTPAKATLCANETALNVGLNFDAYQFKSNISFLDRLSRTFKGSFDANGTLQINGYVHRQDVHLGEGVAANWSFGAAGNDPSVEASADPSIQRRVFRLDEAVRAVIPETQLEHHELVSYPIKVQVRYAQGPLLLAILGALLIALLLAILLLFLGRSRVYNVESDDGGETQVRIGLFGAARALASDGRLYIDLFNLALFLLVSSNGRISRGGLLGLGGGRVEVSMGGAARRPARSRQRARGGYDDDDHDSGPSDDGGDESAVDSKVFSVRAVTGKVRGREEAGDEAY